MSRLILILGLVASAALGGCGKGSGESPPWVVEPLGNGGIEVMGLRPGESTMQDVLDRFGPRVEAALFESGDGALAVEAHYGSVRVAGITGRLIVTLDLGSEQLEALKRASPNYIFQPSGGRRHELDTGFSDALIVEPVRALSFSPDASLEEETLTARFGRPEERVVAADGMVHLLYPAIGTDILVNGDGKEIIQYVHPRDFPWLRERQGV